jgi:MFS transporter, DHA2 family, multidrug resistance protein
MPAVINPWFVAVTVTIATFMELLDTSIANVALPHIAGGLAVSYDESTWVLTSYLVANAVILPMSAWLSRVFGRKRYYMACVAIFTISSVLCGLASSLGALVVCRILQGIGGGGLAPVEQAILVDTFPGPRRAAAFALYSMAIVTAPAVGPILGGWITDSFSWRWIFFINLPLGVISLFLTNRLVSDPPAFTQEVARARQDGRLRIDYLGIALIAGGLGCLEVVLDRGQREDWLESPFIATFLVIAVVSLVAAVIWELHQDDPVVEISLLKNRNFALATSFYFLLGILLFGSTALVPQLLQSLYGYTATDAGLVLGPGAFVIVIMAPLVVRLVTRIPVAALIGTGYVVLALALSYFATFNLATDCRHEALARVIQGVGFAFLFIPITQLAYSYIPQSKNNKASSLTNLFRNLGGSVGIAFVTTMMERRAQFHQSVLVTHLTSGDPTWQAAVAGAAERLLAFGYTTADAAARAPALIAGTLHQQATLLGALDCFWLLAALAMLGPALAIGIRPFEQAGAGRSSGH